MDFECAVMIEIAALLIYNNQSVLQKSGKKFTKGRYNV